jgi:hypothetical protein
LSFFLLFTSSGVYNTDKQNKVGTRKRDVEETRVNSFMLTSHQSSIKTTSWAFSIASETALQQQQKGG